MERGEGDESVMQGKNRDRSRLPTLKGSPYREQEGNRCNMRGSRRSFE